MYFWDRMGLLGIDDVTFINQCDWSPPQYIIIVTIEKIALIEQGHVLNPCQSLSIQLHPGHTSTFLHPGFFPPTIFVPALILELACGLEKVIQRYYGKGYLVYFNF